MTQFSKNEKILANYLLDLDLDPSVLTSSTIANQLGISQSTVVRFAQKLGYTSFRSFLLVLNKGNTEDLKLKGNYLLTSDSTKILISRYADAIYETNILNKSETITLTVQMILDADRIVVFGSSNSSIFAEYLYNQFNKTGLLVQFSKGIHASLVSISQLTSKSIVILISQSGENEETLHVAKQAQTNHVPIIALTGKHKNSLHDYADVVLHCSDYSKDMMNTRISQLFLVDILIQEITERK